MENPIKNNRIVSDHTFALRLYNFIKDCQILDAGSEEEKEYLLRVAKDLVKYQVETAPESEQWYIDNNSNTINTIMNEYIQNWKVNSIKEFLKKEGILILREGETAPEGYKNIGKFNLLEK